ncbi:MAG: hypothetical protein ABII71_00550 [Candidatus Micrarchaeota archaeon]
MLKLNYLLLAAAAFGFLFPGPGVLATDLILPFLAGSLFFSLINSQQVCSFRLPGIRELIPGFLYNYLFLSMVLIIFAFALPEGLREGLILYAICPPAIGMIVISKAWGGNFRNVFGFQIASYSASILLIPAVSIFLFGEAFDALLLLKTLILVFGLPALLTCFIKMKNTDLAADLANILLALVFYVSLSVARESIVNGLSELALVSLALFVLSLVPALYLVKKKEPDAALYSFMKNGGVAAGLSIFFLGPESTLLISIKILIDLFVIILAGRLVQAKEGSIKKSRWDIKS